MKLGDALEKIFKYTGIKWLVNKIVVDWLGYKSCGCEKRKEKLNHIKILFLVLMVQLILARILLDLDMDILTT